MAGIDSIINTRADAFANNPQGLMQRYSMNNDLLDLLALQKMKQDKEAAQRDLQMKMQAPQGTIKDQLQGQVMDMTKREVAQAVGPGLQQLSQQMQAQQRQQMMGSGLPTLPAPNLVGMAGGGIVGYAPGGATTPYGRGQEGRAREAQRRRAEMRLPSDMSPEELAATSEINAQYKTAAGLMGLFTPQTDAERAYAQQVVAALPNMSYADKQALLATGKLPAVERPFVGPPVLPPEQTSTAVPRTWIDDLREKGSAPEPTGIETVLTRPTQRPTGAVAPMDMRYARDALGITAPTAQQPAQQTAQQPAQDPRVSRYEAELASLDAEKNDKMGALIDFLLAAGASGGTNLGATLTGGGSGLRAREQRIKGERADVLKNIETLNLERDKMAQLESQFGRELASQEARSRDELGSLEERNRADIASRERIARLVYDMDNAQLTELKRANTAQELVNTLKEERELTTENTRTLEKAAEVLESYLSTSGVMLTPEERAPYEAALRGAFARLGTPVGSGDADIDAADEILGR